ncbi:glycosyltransferase family 4 protein [soil metagenome]
MPDSNIKYQISNIASPKVAIVHDWLVGGGAERVVEDLHNIYPDAPIYTSYCSDEWRQKLNGKVVTGWLQRFGKFRKFLPVLRIWWFTHLDFTGYDLVISSSGNGEAFGIKTPSDTLHVNYCHAPTHFYWRHYDQYMRQPGFGILNPLAKLGLKLLLKPLRAWDLKASKRADYFIANSTHTQSEIKKFYGRDSVVIFPPVNIARFSEATIKPQPSKPRKGFVTASRQVPYKRLDVIIGACNELKLPLTVIGRGPEHEKLVAQAGDTVSVLENVSDEEMPKLFASAEAFIFAAYEDFGVTPVEALAAGTPVIAYKDGGALDYIRPGINGTFFDVQSVPALCAVLQTFDPSLYQVDAIRTTAEPFGIKAFHQNIINFIDKVSGEAK